MKWKEGQQFENPPAGSHCARCYSLVDLGTQQHTFQGETRVSRDVRISFELPHARMTGKYNPEVKGKPFAVHLTVKQSLHTKANLRRYLEGWRGKKFDKESVETFDPKKLVGLPCRLALIENGDYVNVDSISPLTKAEAKALPKQVNPPVFLSLVPEEFDAKVFESLHEKTREKIAKTPEFVALDNPTAAEEAQSDAPEGDGPGEGVPENDDVPF